MLNAHYMYIQLVNSIFHSLYNIIYFIFIFTNILQNLFVHLVFLFLWSILHIKINKNILLYFLTYVNPIKIIVLGSVDLH